MAPPPPTPSTSMSTSKVPKKSIDRAVKALLKWKSQKPIALKPSFDDEFIYLILTLINPPWKNRPPISNNPHTIPLPNPLISPYSPTFRICLLVKDRYSLSSKQKIESELLPISNVIKLSKFRKEYESFENKKKLCDSYDAFFTDKSMIPVLPRLIGRYFYKRRKDPIGIELGRSDWKEQIAMALGSAMLFLRTGTCSVVKVARESMGREKIVENVAAAIGGVVGVVPKKWKNVRALHLKFPESLAMPIYDGEIDDGGEEMGVLGVENFKGMEREEVGELGNEKDGMMEGRRRENGEVGSGGIVGKKRKKGLEKVSMMEFARCGVSVCGSQQCCIEKVLSEVELFQSGSKSEPNPPVDSANNATRLACFLTMAKGKRGNRWWLEVYPAWSS
ncbi:hypothetical protein Cgig2_021000 [Carnegiea gigantea]|uniref:Ribosomal protein L1 n=1 Tax=Carnegiea gigantea TaxID=171969 RepID=A0A9Q1K9X8_9CARY|nr:hypothetical protein Cgig2_021000 [Carnegiea gigantea]